MIFEIVVGSVLVLGAGQTVCLIMAFKRRSVAKSSFNSTLDILKEANTIARDEVSNIHQGLAVTRSLIEELNKDISELHDRISKSRSMLLKISKKSVIEVEDIHQVISRLNGGL
jgi:predicted  nucleic acid-binding Zn-ribbon protein